MVTFLVGLSVVLSVGLFVGWLKWRQVSKTLKAFADALREMSKELSELQGSDL